MKKSKKWHNQKGISLVETLISVAILGTAVVTFVVALSVGSLGSRALDKETTAQSVAQAQMEYVKNYTYNPSATTYPTLTAPATYTVTVGVTSVSGTDSNIQKITVSVYKDGVLLITLTDYKVNR